MKATFNEFKEKEIINIKSGEKIGFVDDILFDTEKELVSALIVYQRRRFFNLFKSLEDIMIPWEEIEIIGEDTILVKSTPEMPDKKAKKPTIFDKLFL